ncbi:MAG: hypothetical protein LH650_14250 [Chloroflexi bacterium]|nr:hypothetical protein [Chloroflexota bacterium]
MHGAATLAMALVLSSAGAAVADRPVGHSGLTGAHSLTDSAEYSGGRCRYDSDSKVQRVRVMPPTMFARNRTSSRDQQWVGWRVELRYRPVDGSWSTIQTSSPVKVRAWDDTPAALAARSIMVAHPVGSGVYRVIVRMTWYRHGTSNVWEGTSRHAVEHYTYPLAEPGQPTECPAGIL